MSAGPAARRLFGDAPRPLATRSKPRRLERGRLKHLLAGLLFCSSALAQSELKEFLAPLQAHPALLAAAANLRAAELRLGGAYEPFALSVTGGVSAFDTDALDLAPEVPGEQGLPGTGGQFGADLTVKPFPQPELVDERRLALEDAALAYRETLSGLEAQALEAALGAQLAEVSLETARQGADLAEGALASTRLRFSRGAATERELREAEALWLEAQGLAEDAEAGIALAEQALEQLLPGGGTLDVAGLSLAVPTGTPLSVARTELAGAGAELALSVSAKRLLPVLQAGYTWNLDERSSLGVSLESRTLQPRLSYDYQDPGRSPPQSAINGSFQVGVALSLSPADFAAAEAAQAQVAAAKASLEATQAGARLERQGLENALASAQRQLELAQLRLGNAELTLEETQRREALGLGIPLDTQRAALEHSQAALEWQRARQGLLTSLLDFYRFYALPITEVAP